MCENQMTINIKKDKKQLSAIYLSLDLSSFRWTTSAFCSTGAS